MSDDWYEEAQNRKSRRALWEGDLAERQQQQPGVERLWSALTAGDALRGRVIRLITSALKRVREQAGAVQCDNCGKWFRSSGGLAVHKRARV